MLPDRVSNPGPLTYESGALPIALRGPAIRDLDCRVKEKNAGLSAEMTSEVIKNFVQR